MVIAFDYGDSTSPLSMPRVVAIIVAIGIACFMDYFYMYSNKVFSITCWITRFLSIYRTKETTKFHT